MKNAGATTLCAKAPSPQKAATRSPSFTAAAGGRAAHDSPDLAAGHEGEGWLELVEPARLQQLGEGDPGGVHLDRAFPRPA